jgi:formylglycine-generating enzyme required for sulfatase activity
MRKSIILAAAVLVLSVSYVSAAVYLDISGPGVASTGGGNYEIEEGAIVTVSVVSDSNAPLNAILYLQHCPSNAYFSSSSIQLFNGTMIIGSYECLLELSLGTSLIPDTQATVDIQTAGVPGQTFELELRNGASNVISSSIFLTISETPCFPACHPDYNEWVALGMPVSWCNPRQCKGDADGGLNGDPKLGYFYVKEPDLLVLISAWKVAEAPDGPGINSVLNGIAADFDHRASGSPYTGYYRVGASDFNILRSNMWTEVDPDCADCGGCGACPEEPQLSLQVGTPGGSFSDPGDSYQVEWLNPVNVGILNPNTDIYYDAYLVVTSGLDNGSWTGSTWVHDTVTVPGWTYFGASIPGQDAWMLEMYDSDFSWPWENFSGVLASAELNVTGLVTVKLYNEFFEEVDSLDLIGPHMEVISPNGGETLTAGSTYTIDWTEFGGPLTVSYDVEYSIDNGASWTTISGSDEGTYIEWQVPMVDSDQCLIRVSGYGDTSDTSDSTFAIHPCFPTCHPDFEEWLSVGQPESWCYPYQCKGDVNGEFTVESKCGAWQIQGLDLAVLIEAWKIKEPPHGPGIDAVSLYLEYYSKDYPGIAADIDHRIAGSPYTGYYRVGMTDFCILADNWKNNSLEMDCQNCDGITGGTPGPDLHLRISSESGFIDPGDSVILDLGQQISIGIENLTTGPQLYTAYVEMAGNLASGDWTGTTWYDLAASESTWTYYGSSILPDRDAWQVEVFFTDLFSYFPPLAPVSSSLQYHQVASGDTTIILYNEFYEEVDRLIITTSPPYIELTSPVGGEEIIAGSTYPITWNSNLPNSNVMIKYTDSDGLEWAVIEESTPNDGLYEWTVPQITSELVTILVSDADNPSLSHYNPDPFTIFVCELDTPADIDDNCKVGLGDLIIMTNDWLAADSIADIAPLPDGDQVVDFNDFTLIAADWLRNGNPYDDDFSEAPEDMTFIPNGQFNMGDHFAEGDPSELPVHNVYLDSFYMSKCEITNQQYCDFLNSALSQSLIEVNFAMVFGVGGSDYYIVTAGTSEYCQIIYSGGVFSIKTKGDADMSNHPVVEITWFGAVAYCNWRSQQEGYESCYDLSTWTCDFTKKGYRLPTEAEWHYAARGGNKNPYTRFPWGDTISHTQANYIADSATRAYDISPTQGYHPSYDDGIEPITSPVGSFALNGYGLYDMAGNIFEWCNDWYSDGYFAVSPIGNPTGPATGTHRVLLGGGWAYDAYYSRSSARFGYLPNSNCFNRGIRVVLDLN